MNRPPWIITWLLAAALIYVSCFKAHGEDAPNLTGAYVAKVISVHDGDTFRCDIDLGFGVEMRNIAVRMVGVYAPELGKPSGAEATAKLKELLPVGSTIVLRPLMTVTATPAHEIMTFQRYVARIWRKDLDICEEMNRFLTKSETAPKK